MMMTNTDHERNAAPLPEHPPEVSVRQMRSQIGALMNEVEFEGKTVVITRYLRPSVVMISARQYARLVELDRSAA